MRIVIPAAGTGTRLKPHTNQTPKPLLTVAGKPLLEHLLQPLLALEPSEIVFIVGFKGDMIEEFVREKVKIKTSFVHQKELLGLGFAIYLALKDLDDQQTLIILGDTVVDCDLAKFVAAGENVLGLCEVADPQRFGIAKIENDMIVDVEEKPEKPKTNLALIGLYYFSRTELLKSKLTALINSNKRTSGEIQFTDALQNMITEGTRFVPFEVNQWYDCGKKETLLATSRHFLEKLDLPRAPTGSTYIPPVYIDKNAMIANSIIGPNVSVGPGARVENSIVRNCIMEKNATAIDANINNSLLGPDTLVRGSVLSLSIGESSRVEADGTQDFD